MPSNIHCCPTHTVTGNNIYEMHCSNSPRLFWTTSSDLRSQRKRGWGSCGGIGDGGGWGRQTMARWKGQLHLVHVSQFMHHPVLEIPQYSFTICWLQIQHFLSNNALCTHHKEYRYSKGQFSTKRSSRHLKFVLIGIKYNYKCRYWNAQPMSRLTRYTY